MFAFVFLLHIVSACSFYVYLHFPTFFQFHCKLIAKTTRNNYLQFSDILAANVAFVITACRNTTFLRITMIHIIT